MMPQCKCIDNFTENLKRETEAEYVHVDYLYLRVSYKGITKKGEVNKHWKHTGMHFKCCPFCGVRYTEVKS